VEVLALRVGNSKGYFNLTELIISSNWNTLIVLDSCSYKLFKQECTLNGLLYRAQSKGHDTTTFYESLPSLKYVTLYSANEQLCKNRAIKRKFKEVIPSKNSYIWDNLLEAQSIDERIIIQTLLPRLPNQGEYADLWFKLKEKHKLDTTKFYDIIEKQNIKTNDVLASNLRVALQAIGKNIDKLERPVVITSSHGYPSKQEEDIHIVPWFIVD